jgi:hypothetical protein
MNQIMLPLRRFLGALGVSALTLIAAHAAPSSNNPPTSTVRFGVLSDPHLYDVKLGTSGAAFDTYLATDPKLLTLSEPILEAAIADVIHRQVRFVIISGDLTKDGEVLNHVLMTQHLQKLEQAGVQVFVVPGNHDINNPDAVEFRGASTKPVPTASPEVFRALYQRFGYGEALSHAPDSLSYVAEPVPGLWLLAIDSTKHTENVGQPHPIVSGRVSGPTLSWAIGKIQEAQAKGKKVIAFMHHGVNLHFLSEFQLFPDFLVDNWPMVGAALENAGLKVVFTGHDHSQDASALSFGPQGLRSSQLVDIQTGSLATYPCAYRIGEIDAGGTLHVTSHPVTNVAANLGGKSLQQFAHEFGTDLLRYQVIAVLMQQFGLSQAAAANVAPIVVEALLANYGGDEAPSAAVQALLANLTSLGQPYATLAQLLGTLWSDPSLADGEVFVSLQN